MSGVRKKRFDCLVTKGVSYLGRMSGFVEWKTDVRSCGGLLRVKVELTAAGKKGLFQTVGQDIFLSRGVVALVTADFQPKKFRGSNFRAETVFKGSFADMEELVECLEGWVGRGREKIELWKTVREIP